MFDFYDVTPVQIFHRLTQVTGNPLPYALVVVMLVGERRCCTSSGKFILGRRHDAGVTKASIQSSASRLRGSQSVPRAAAVPDRRRTRAPAAHRRDPDERQRRRRVVSIRDPEGLHRRPLRPRAHARFHACRPCRNSVAFASASMVLDIALGLMIAWLIVRSTLPGPAADRQPGDAAAGGAGASCWRSATSRSACSCRRGSAAIGTWLRDLVDVQQNPTVLLVVAYAMRRLPYVVRSAVAGTGADAGRSGTGRAESRRVELLHAAADHRSR